MTKPELISLARLTAKAHGVDPALFCAVIHHESADWKQYASRYEPAFFKRYLESMNLSDTEKYSRAFSYGLTQLMGQTAREFGFKGEYCSELFDPYVNLEFGCRKLADCLKHEGNDVNKSLLRYNGGSNPNYPNLVLQHLVDYTETA